MQATENNTQLPILIASFSAVFGAANDAEAPSISRSVTCSREACWEGMWKKISSPFVVHATGESISEPTPDRSGRLGKTSRLEWVISAVWTRVPLPESKHGTSLEAGKSFAAQGAERAESWEATAE
jgi:hypothetical protein